MYAVWRAAILAIAIVVRPVNHPVTTPAPATIIQTVSDAEIQTRIDAAVTKAVAQAEARQEEKTKKVLAQLDSTRRSFLIAASAYEMDQKRVKTFLASAYSMPPESGEPK